MKTTMLLAIVGAIVIIGAAGAVTASGTVAKAFGGSCSGDAAGTGHMNQHGYQYMWQYEGEDTTCPMEHNWDYSWNHNYSYCDCPDD
jgi:hypothetical protein